uniref:Methyltransferase n=2 Tax=viral metagenome TaxID=1070528 RepID=A0A6M3JSQ1_9ZZZZ
MNKSLSIVGFGKNRDSADFYPTPPQTTEALFKRERFDGVVWECACGDGAMVKVIEKYNSCMASDIRTDCYVYAEGGVDFLTNYKEVPNIITNPPYKYALEFAQTALLCAEKKVALLLKLVFLEGISRYNFFRNSPLKTVYVFCKRQPIWIRGEVGKNSGLIAYAWFVWDKSYKGQPYIDWIND